MYVVLLLGAVAGIQANVKLPLFQQQRAKGTLSLNNHRMHWLTKESGRGQNASDDMYHDMHQQHASPLLGSPPRALYPHPNSITPIPGRSSFAFAFVVFLSFSFAFAVRRITMRALRTYVS